MTRGGTERVGEWSSWRRTSRRASVASLPMPAFSPSLSSTASRRSGEDNVLWSSTKPAGDLLICFSSLTSMVPTMAPSPLLVPLPTWSSLRRGIQSHDKDL